MSLAFLLLPACVPCSPGEFGCIEDRCDIPENYIHDRYPPKDEFCSSMPECHLTSGSPAHDGCPNTCQCLCYEGRAYIVRLCTAMDCGDMPPECN